MDQHVQRKTTEHEDEVQAITTVSESVPVLGASEGAPNSNIVQVPPAPPSSEPEPKPRKLAEVDAQAKLLQWTAAQAFDNVKFMDQKAAVLAASVGVFGAKIGEIVIAQWPNLSPLAKGLFGLGAVLLVAALSACLLVLWPRGRDLSELSQDENGLEYLDADTASIKLPRHVDGTLPRDLPADIWLAAHVKLIQNRGHNAKAKGDWFRRAVGLCLVAIAIECAGVVVHINHW